MTCLNNTSVAGCYASATGNVGVVIHYTFDNAGAPKVVIADVSGAVVAGANLANTTPGDCAVASPDVEFEILCDKLADGTVIEFVRRTVTTFSATGVPTTVISNLGMDYITPYTPQGGVGACNQDCDAVAPVGLVTTWG